MRKLLPTLEYEKKLWKKNYLVVGIDEVGRGALAGPLVVGAVCFFRNINHLEKLGINDSKKLSAKKREELSEIIKNKSFVWAVASVSVRFINKYGIVKAFQKGVREVIKKIKKKQLENYFLLIDGFYIKHLAGIGLKNQKAIIHGDEKSISIASASIIAKVYRDRLMIHLSKKYPQYRWEKNKGYGTKDHIKALKKFGETRHHRRLFLRKILQH